MDAARWARVEREARTRRRQHVLVQLRQQVDPPLNDHCAAVVHAFNYLLKHVETSSTDEFVLHVRNLVNANLRSVRLVKHVYIDDFLDEVGVYEYAHRRAAAGLLLKRDPLARSDPKGALEKIYAIVGQDRMVAWTHKLVAETQPNVKVRWQEYRNPYKLGNMGSTIHL